MHAEAWLFHRNLSASALLDGLEWNVRLCVVDNRAVLEKFATTFEQYWGESGEVGRPRGLPANAAATLTRAAVAGNAAALGGLGSIDS